MFIDMFHEFTHFIVFEHKTSKKVPLAVDTTRTYLGNVKVRLELTPLKTNFGRYTLDLKDPWWYQFIRSSNGEYQRRWVVEDGEEPTDAVRVTAVYNQVRTEPTPPTPPCSPSPRTSASSRSCDFESCAARSGDLQKAEKRLALAFLYHSCPGQVALVDAVAKIEEIPVPDAKTKLSMRCTGIADKNKANNEGHGPVSHGQRRHQGNSGTS